MLVSHPPGCLGLMVSVETVDSGCVGEVVDISTVGRAPAADLIIVVNVAAQRVRGLTTWDFHNLIEALVFLVVFHLKRVQKLKNISALFSV